MKCEINLVSPIFVQEYIEKQFEIRVFFFNEMLFSMAIFSQNDMKTKVDFRNYNSERPNRCIPFVKVLKKLSSSSLMIIMI